MNLRPRVDRPAPLCQQEIEANLLVDDRGLVEQVAVEPPAGVENLDADGAAVLPVEYAEALDVRTEPRPECWCVPR